MRTHATAARRFVASLRVYRTLGSFVSDGILAEHNTPRDRETASGRATTRYCVAGPPAGITMVWLRAGDTYPIAILATSFIEGMSTTRVLPPTGSAR
jgi:hypothetical protein